jgi:hypothetical protein
VLNPSGPAHPEHFVSKPHRAGDGRVHQRPAGDSTTQFNISICCLAEHNFVTGDDRGGIALSNTHVFYTGDSRTGAFPVNSASTGSATSILYDALVKSTTTAVQLIP